MPPSLTLFHSLLLFSTAFIAGGLNAVAGGGSFITFPTLIFTGVSPIAANATNNTAIWVAALASAGAYRQDLDIERRDFLLLCSVSLVGGIIGSVALLYTSPDVFKKLIPYLLLLATLVFTFGEPFKKCLQRQSQKSSPESVPLFNLVLAQLAIAIYGGFFGAGLGILMLATLTFLGIKSIHTINAFKTCLGSCINGIAIIPFIFAGVIAWYQAILMAVGGSLGGYLSAMSAKRSPKVENQKLKSVEVDEPYVDEPYVIDAGGLPIPQWSVEAALKMMDEQGIATGIVSVSTPGVHLGNDAEARSKAREVNEFVAQVVRDRPDRFGFFATLTLPDVEGAIADQKIEPSRSSAELKIENSVSRR